MSGVITTAATVEIAVIVTDSTVDSAAGLDPPPNTATKRRPPPLYVEREDGGRGSTSLLFLLAMLLAAPLIGCDDDGADGDGDGDAQFHQEPGGLEGIRTVLGRVGFGGVPRRCNPVGLVVAALEADILEKTAFHVH